MKENIPMEKWTQDMNRKSQKNTTSRLPYGKLCSPLVIQERKFSKDLEIRNNWKNVIHCGENATSNPFKRAIWQQEQPMPQNFSHLLTH